MVIWDHRVAMAWADTWHCAPEALQPCQHYQGFLPAHQIQGEARMKISLVPWNEIASSQVLGLWAMLGPLNPNLNHPHHPSPGPLPTHCSAKPPCPVPLLAWAMETRGRGSPSGP